MIDPPQRWPTPCFWRLKGLVWERLPTPTPIPIPIPISAVQDWPTLLGIHHALPSNTPLFPHKEHIFPPVHPLDPTNCTHIGYQCARGFHCRSQHPESPTSRLRSASQNLQWLIRGFLLWSG